MTIRVATIGTGYFIKPHAAEEAPHSYRWEDRGHSGDSVHALQSHVVAHLRDGAPVENTAREYVRNIEIEQAIYRSNAEERWIDVAMPGTPALSSARHASR